MAHASADAGLIGPNAIIRVAETLRDVLGEEATRRIFASAHLEPHLASLPTKMVPEADVGALQTALFAGLEESEAKKIAFEAGLRTGDYLLANRIPKPVQAILKVLPPALASRILLKAIKQNSWTFAGTGAFSVKAGHPVIVSIASCPLCRGRHSDHSQCDYYAGTFQRLFQVLVSRNSAVREIDCEATGGSACAFEISWSKPANPGGSQRVHTGKAQS
jgi:divinyl protochlorophyllide a 8-vinyl-reductase